MRNSKNHKGTTNPTLIRLKGTPFKTATELKIFEDKILKDEWQSVERARVRRELLMKAENKKIIAPFINGFNAKFIAHNSENENLIRIYLTAEEAIQVDIDNQLRSKDTNEALESLIKSLVGGFLGGYLTALGLNDDGVFKSSHAKSQLAEEV
jgi:hypothetical protein